VDLYSYADFNSVDRQDRYRLMDMSARCRNRDGAALRYVAEKLAKQNAEIKLLMIISDGQPNDDGYSGSAAEADLRGIKVEFSRKGVDLYAAAIGDDKENIERTYGSGFLDITDLNQLPILLTNIIARNIK
jgi:nitric oxide reductase activation protein